MYCIKYEIDVDWCEVVFLVVIEIKMVIYVCLKEWYVMINRCGVIWRCVIYFNILVLVIKRYFWGFGEEK